MHNTDFTPLFRTERTPYDLEVLAALHTSGHYRERIEAFRSRGLVNLGGHRVRLVLLTGTSDMGDYTDGWPCEVVVIPGESDDAAVKNHLFYGMLPEDYYQNARWFCRVDDDSCTDVAGLLDRLDLYYDDQDPDYVMADVCWDLNPCYQQILQDMGAGHLLPNEANRATTLHEWEGCVVSQAAMGRLNRNPTAREFLARCMLLEGGQADHPLAVAAQLAKIHPSDCWFLTAQPEVDNFSLFGGKYVHLHFVAPDTPAGSQLQGMLGNRSGWAGNERFTAVVSPTGFGASLPEMDTPQVDAAPLTATALPVHTDPPRDQHAGTDVVRTLFVTVSDASFFPGTVATVNSVRQFHPDADIVVVNSNLDKSGLSDAQKAVLADERVSLVEAEQFRRPDRKLAAWELKAYGALELSGGYDALVGIDSDCVLCGPLEDVIADALRTGRFYGGSDGKTYYDDSYRAYGIETPVVNDKYMSTSLYVCALTDTNRQAIERWTLCCNEATFGGRDVYPGHGDQGVLNAVLFHQRGSEAVELLNNHLWSQHWCYWEDELLAEKGILIHAAQQQQQRSIHCGGTEKFWTKEHVAKLEWHPEHVTNYAWFLSFFWFGRCRDWQRAPEEYLSPETDHLLRDLWQFRGDIAAVNPRNALQMPEALLTRAQEI